jgi:hypothetical protein
MEPSAAKVWLDFISAFIWQVIVAACLIYLRRQLAGLVDRIARVKVGETEIAFQSPSETASKPKGDAALVADLVGSDGFYTQGGLARVVEGSGLVEPGEKVRDSHLLFQTGEQQTWLIATGKQLFCILDDKRTRASGRLIQWRLPLGDAKPVKARRYKKGVGLISIGDHDDWLYSTHLHADPHRLETEVMSLIEG